MAEVLVVPSDRVRIVAGQASRTKVVEIDGVTREAIDASFEAAASA